jgi:predicted TIM-barrel fold metal-dependent hydrolase
VKKKMVIIDAHTHLPRESSTISFVHKTLEELVREMNENGVDITVTMPNVYPGETSLKVAQAENDWIAQCVKKHPKQLIGLGLTNVFLDTPPTPGEMFSSVGAEMGAKEVERCITELGLKGIKLHGSLAMCPIYLRPLRQILQKCVELKVPLIEVHSSFHQSTNRPERIAYIAQYFPELTFYMNHMGGPHGELNAIGVAKYTPNIVLGTSACDKWAIKYAVKQAGADRVLWASDNAYHSIEAEMAKLKSAALSREEFELVAGGNMARILGLRT